MTGRSWVPLRAFGGGACPDDMGDLKRGKHPPKLVPQGVIRDNRLRAAGRRLGDAVVYDWGFELDGRQYEQRSIGG
jgi:hypothetical protein